MSRLTAGAVAGAAGGPGGGLRRLAASGGPFVTIAAILIAWELLARTGAVVAFLLPPLSTVVLRIAGDLLSGDLIVDVATTLWRALAGFSLAAVVGVTLGILISRAAPVRWFFDPLISIGLPMPKIALLPVFMLWFGLYDTSKILMVAFSASFQITIATWAATRSVDRELVWSARSLGASPREILWQVILPGAAPQILTGLQVALPICMIVVLVTEMAMGGGGLGHSMLQSARYVDSPGVFAGIVEIGLLGFCVIRTMERIRRRLLMWHPETRRETTV